MKKTKQPSTSIEAYHQADEIIKGHQLKIVAALKKLSKGNAYAISTKCDLDKHQIAKRMSELAEQGIVHKTGTKAPTDSNRQSEEYALTEIGNRINAGELTIATPPVVERIKQHKKKQEPVHNSIFD